MRHAGAFSSVHCFLPKTITVFPSHGRTADCPLNSDHKKNNIKLEYIKTDAWISFLGGFSVAQFVLSSYFTFKAIKSIVMAY